MDQNLHRGIADFSFLSMPSAVGDQLVKAQEKAECREATTFSQSLSWSMRLGYPRLHVQMINKSNGAIYSEVDAFSTLLQYKTANAGCCKV